MTLSLPMESVHPMVVHFPIALLLTAVGCDLAAVALRRPVLRQAALWNLSLGTVAAAMAVWTGLRAEDVAKHSFEIHQVMELHERLGKITLALALMAVSWRVAKRDRLSARARVITSLLMLAMAMTLAWGGYLGGRLVYEFGVGGRFGAAAPGANPAEDTPHDHHKH